MDTAVDKALHVLGALEVVANGRSLAEVAAETGLPKATAHRLLATLVRNGFVRQLANGNYVLGLRLVALGTFAASHNDLTSLGRAVLDRLVVECGETVHLGVLQGDSLLYVDRREPENAAVRLATLPSPLTSLHASASGKLLLAFGPSSLVESVLDQDLPAYTRATITDGDALRAELEQIRSVDHAINRQERYDGVVAVGVPVRNQGGEVVAALSAAGPVHRVDDARLDELRGPLSAAARELGSALR